MAARRRRVVWTEHARRMLDDAVSYIAQDSRIFSERGRIVPELTQPNVRQLLVQRYRLLYEVTPAEVQVLAFVHGARDLTGPGFEG